MGMAQVDIKKPVWKVCGQLSATNDEVIKGEVGRRIISFVNADSEATAFEAAKVEWPEGTEFTSAHQINPATGLKLSAVECAVLDAPKGSSWK
jgi:hypothetical protein